MRFPTSHATEMRTEEISTVLIGLSARISFAAPFVSAAFFSVRFLTRPKTFRIRGEKARSARIKGAVIANA